MPTNISPSMKEAGRLLIGICIQLPADKADRAQRYSTLRAYIPSGKTAADIDISPEIAAMLQKQLGEKHPSQVSIKAEDLGTTLRAAGRHCNPTDLGITAQAANHAQTCPGTERLAVNLAYLLKMLEFVECGKRKHIKVRLTEEGVNSLAKHCVHPGDS